MNPNDGGGPRQEIEELLIVAVVLNRDENVQHSPLKTPHVLGSHRDVFESRDRWRRKQDVGVMVSPEEGAAPGRYREQYIGRTGGSGSIECIRKILDGLTVPTETA
jgi:hypothetical protein